MKINEVKNFSKSDAEMVDVMDTFQRVISIMEKEMAKNPAFLQKELDTRNTNNVMAALIIRKTSRSKAFSKQCQGNEAYHREDHRRFMRKHSRSHWDRPLPLKLDTPKTVENAHNTADTKCSVSYVAKIAVMSKDTRDSIRN